MRLGSGLTNNFHPISPKENRGVPLFLVEGGTWRWPAIRVGFSREVLSGVRLRTVAVQPALFDLEFSNSEGAGWGWYGMLRYAEGCC